MDVHPGPVRPFVHRLTDRLTDRLDPARTLGRLVRYGAVSGVTTTLSLTLLCVLLSATSLPASVANLLAQGAGIPVAYVLYRRWVWRRSGRASLRRETGPFWIMSAAGLALSTVATATVSHLEDGLPHSARTLVVAAASLAAYGALWLAEFMLLDRVVFAASPQRAGPGDPADVGRVPVGIPRS